VTKEELAVFLDEQTRLFEERINQKFDRILDSVAELAAGIIRRGGLYLPDDPVTGELIRWIPAAEVTAEHIRSVMRDEPPRTLQ
jgi:hypothetical protein